MASADDIVALRIALDAVDREIVALLRERLRLVGEVAQRKQAGGAPARDPARERWLLRRLGRLARAEGVDPGLVRRIYGVILQDSVARQRGERLNVVYQGGRGSFSEVAVARLFAGRAPEARGVSTFSDALDALTEGRADRAVLPVHNDVIGRIGAVADRVEAEGLRVERTLSLRVELCVLGVQDVPLSAIRELRSQAEALGQCGRLLRGLPGCVAVSWEDTGRAAESVLVLDDPSVAALAGPQAASLLGLRVLARDVADQPAVHTRFAVLARG
jgi:chorismate mutase/prephenate dehydratase